MASRISLTETMTGHWSPDVSEPILGSGATCLGPKGFMLNSCGMALAFVLHGCGVRRRQCNVGECRKYPRSKQVMKCRCTMYCSRA